MAYVPRDSEEAEIVWALVQASHDFARSVEQPIDG